MIHPYFLATHPSQWDIIEFCEQQSNLDDYDYDKTVVSWVTSLDHLRGEGNPEVAWTAKLKSEKFYRDAYGQLSDCEVVQNWYKQQDWHKQQNRNKRKGQPLAKEGPTKQRITSVFHLGGEFEKAGCEYEVVESGEEMLDAADYELEYGELEEVEAMGRRVNGEAELAIRGYGE